MPMLPEQSYGHALIIRYVLRLRFRRPFQDQWLRARRACRLLVLPAFCWLRAYHATVDFLDRMLRDRPLPFSNH